MDEPKRLELTPKEVSALLDRLDRGELSDEDCHQLKEVLLAMVWMGQKLEDKDLSIRRLQRLFGIKTEKAENIFGGNKKDDDNGSSGSSGASSNEGAGGKGDSDDSGTKCGGQHGADDYPDSEKIIHPHESLKIGDPCPDCGCGTLYFYGYGSVVKLVGQPSIRAVIHQPEQLRCSACLKLFTAKLPDNVSKGRADPTAKSMVAIFRYGSGIPFYRNEGLQEGLRTPLPDSTQWDMSEDVGNAAWPIFNELIDCAATSDLLHLDDTGGKILSLMKEIKDDKRERKGIFTTGILARTYENREICLMFTGNRHAGENVQTLLNKRPENLPLVKLMCDALNRNEPKKTKVILGNCNDHARREFVDLIPAKKDQPPPDECVYFISRLGIVYHNDSLTKKMTKKSRLEYHKKHSRPIMDELFDWCWQNIENKKVEPNSSMGKAMKYFINHFEELVKFTEVEGMPLSNAAVERLLKMVVLHRKNSLFYKTENGAAIGDILMSVIQTAKRSGVNVFDYLTTLQQNKSAVKKNPKAWLPWNYQQQPITLQISH
jgi:transposase